MKKIVMQGKEKVSELCLTYAQTEKKYCSSSLCCSCNKSVKSPLALLKMSVRVVLWWILSFTSLSCDPHVTTLLYQSEHKLCLN